MTTTQPMIDDVGKTALGTAYVRARESDRSDQLFNDPYADAFIKAAPRSLLEKLRGPVSNAVPSESIRVLREALNSTVIIRTKFMDDYLVSMTEGLCKQVVILGAGLDTRAFRLILSPDIRVFELDVSAVLTYKDTVLAEKNAHAQCARVVVPQELQSNWSASLIAAGFDSRIPTLWLAEGLLTYLETAAVSRLFSTINSLSCSGGQIVFDDGEYMLERFGEDPILSTLIPNINNVRDTETSRFLTSLGWKVNIHESRSLADSYGRSELGQDGFRLVTATLL